MKSIISNMDRKQIVVLFAILYAIYFVISHSTTVETTIQEPLDDLASQSGYEGTTTEKSSQVNVEFSPPKSEKTEFYIIEFDVDDSRSYAGNIGMEIKQWSRDSNTFASIQHETKEIASTKDFFTYLKTIAEGLSHNGVSMIVDVNANDYQDMISRKFNMKAYLSEIGTSNAINVIDENGGFTRFDLVVDRYHKSHMRFPLTKIAHGYFAGKNELIIELASLIETESIQLYDDDIVTDMVARACLSMFHKCRRSRRKSSTWKLGLNSYDQLLYPAPLYYLHIPKCGSSFAGVLVHHTCPNTHFTSIMSPRDAKKDPDFIENCASSKFISFAPGHHPLYNRKIAKGHIVSSFRPTVERIVSGYFHNKHDCGAALRRIFPLERVRSPFDEGVLRQYTRMVHECATRMLLGYWCCHKDKITEADVQKALKIVDNDYAFVFRQDKYTESAHQWKVLYGSDFGNLQVEFNTRPTAASQLQIEKAKAVVRDTLANFTDDRIFELVERKWNAQAERVKLLEQNPNLQDFTDLEMQVLQGKVKEDDF